MNQIGKVILGRVDDSERNSPKPALDIYLPRGVAEHCGWKHNEPIELVLDQKGPWVGSVGIKPPHEPYLHRRVSRHGEKRSLRDLLLEMGIRDKAKLEFSLEGRNRLRFRRIVDSGRWPPGKAPSERRPRSVVRTPETPETTSATNAKPDAPFPIADAAAVTHWANRYWELISPAERDAEHRFAQALPRYREMGHLDKRTFVELARWKSTRGSALYAQNSEERVRDATHRAFLAQDELEAITMLCELSGVQLRTASALLHWMRPDEFPILDFRVVGALGEPEPSDWNDFAFYQRVATRVRKIAEQLGVDLRTLDRALWAWQKAHGLRPRTPRRN